VVTVNTAYVDLSAQLKFNAPPTAQALPGTPVSVTLEIVNNGNVVANGNILSSFSVSGHSDGTASLFVESLKEHVHIAAGGHQFFKIVKPVPIGSLPGNYYLVASVDTTNTLDESDLTNNSAVSPTQLTVLDPYPNLLGSFSGTYTIKHGPDKGVVVRRVGEFTDEDDTTGAFAYTATNYYPNGTTASIAGDGTITPAGVYKTHLLDNSTTSVGRLLKGVLTGTFKSINGDSGTFRYVLTG
jgi:hypothetical protein